jgi:hypothetical protein
MKKLLLSAALLWAAIAPALALAPPDSLKPASHPVRPWYRPTHLVLQAAGGIGMVSGGAGYEFAKNRLEVDAFIGYVPKKYAGSTLSTFTGKALYSPFRVALGPKWQLLPLSVGAYFSHTHNTINDGVKGQYSADYYWFSHDNFYGPLLGSRITFLAPPIRATGQVRKISLYYELSTNDLYLLSYTTNTSGLAFGKIIVLGLGLKADF